jgi:glutathione synthase/RimK-type ligase-like ATP-grasp enzyme
VILIVSDPLDGHVRLVEQRLRGKGARVARLDVGEVPRQVGVSALVEDGSPTRIQARRERGDLDFGEVETVWFRRCHPVKPDPRLAPADQEFAAKEATAFVFSLAVALGDRFCVNPIASGLATDHGKGKVSQLDVAVRHGLSVPRTLATNDPEAASDFLRSCREGAIYKPFLAPTRSEDNPDGTKKWQSIFTTKLDERALERLEGVRFAPCIFQELVPKKVELRVTVLGKKVFATEIHSQVNEKSSVDFRAHYDLGKTPYFPHELPDEVVARLLAVHADLGLVFGAYDLILTPEGRYVFLEVNQQGQFLWLEAQTGQPLLENFCELLIQATPDFECDAPRHAPGLPEVPPLDPITERELAEFDEREGAQARQQGARKRDARRKGGRRREMGTGKGKGKGSKTTKGKGKGKRI